MRISFPELTVDIATEVINVLRKYEQNEDKYEAGGVLLGKYSPTDEHYYITMVTEPSSQDSCGRLWFVRNRESAQVIIDRIWEESQGIENYLGEWHTHPCHSPKPSFTDMRLMEGLISDGSNVWGYLFMVIVGLEGSLYLGVWDAGCKSKVYEKMIGDD